MAGVRLRAGTHDARGEDYCHSAAACFEREEVQQHLKPHAVNQTSDMENSLRPVFVVDLTRLELAVMSSAVAMVGDTRDGTGPFPAAELDRRHFARVGKIKLKVQRLEVRPPQLRRHILDDAHTSPHRRVDEAALSIKIVELRSAEKRSHSSRRVLSSTVKLPPRLDLARGLLKDIVVHECADLRGAEGGGLTGLLRAGRTGRNTQSAGEQICASAEARRCP